MGGKGRRHRHMWAVLEREVVIDFNRRRFRASAAARPGRYSVDGGGGRCACDRDRERERLMAADLAVILDHYLRAMWLRQLGDTTLMLLGGLLSSAAAGGTEGKVQR